MDDIRRLVVTGASGNVGSGVLRALSAQLPDAEVVGVCRRPPAYGSVYDGVRWHSVDLASPTAALDLEPVMAGADAVIHLALSLYPLDDEEYLYRANVLGTEAVLDAMHAAGIRRLVYASSLGIYAPGGATPVTEDYSTAGQPRSVYSRQKIAVERILDRFESAHPEVAVSRFRPTAVAQRETATMVRSLYLGPLVPRSVFKVLRQKKLPVMPLPAGLALQFVHTDDVGDAVVRMLRQEARGSYNVASDILDAEDLARLVGARPLPLPPRVVRGAVTVANTLRLVALTPGWYDVAFNTPKMDSSKAHRELGWAPAWSSADAAEEIIAGLAAGSVGPSAALDVVTAPWSDAPTIIDRIHDVSLVLWTAMALTRAAGIRRAGLLDAAVIATNLVAGTPMAAGRIGQRRRDAVALLAPPAVVTAVLSTARGGWLPVAATAVLQVFAATERRRRRFRRAAAGS